MHTLQSMCQATYILHVLIAIDQIQKHICDQFEIMLTCTHA